ncbi:cysteine hydrolase family protein [Limoniibacter endophyticus]|uniref:Isochorismatase-like domain-containing protein n=1 Tax=Limoniibacter endophyticus TaxID=1565040 RepID=A0A8J3GGS9_9HYPH|nr:isochorismatase family cysteine hydrolase [Limoniibacter endophyticus]GHC67482.1 hypothetical protein GCM10010136_11570 [Limoniibacter endophyticus]
MPGIDQPALLIIDPQVSFCDAGGSMARQGRPIDSLRAAATNCGRLADQARDGGAIVIWTRMIFEEGYADGGELINTIRPGLAKIGALLRGSGDECFSEVVCPAADDLIIDKNRFSALVNTSLEAILREKNVKRVFVCGVTTSMCVESTVRDLGQRDFKTFVVQDACADFDEPRHESALVSMAFGFARLITMKDAQTALNGNSDE